MIDIPLLSIPLELTTLSETWASTLSIDTGHPNWTWLPIYPNWSCVVNFEHKLLFTELASDIRLKRDLYFEYLLAIDDKFIIVACDGIRAHIKNMKGCEGFDIDELKKLINRCAKFVYTNYELIWED